jgi:hypothetical protein
MTGVLALLSATVALSHLPALPQRGLALETKAGVELQTLAGRRLAALPGLDLATDQTTAHTLVLRDRQGRLFALDPATRRLRQRPFRKGCRTTDVELVVCTHMIRSRGLVVGHAPSKIGHWVWAERAPSGDSVLAQWSAECEVPVAYLIAAASMRAYALESVALGWLPRGDALIHFPSGPCGGTIHVRGIYAVARSGRMRLVLRTARFAQYAMWGG